MGQTIKNISRDYLPVAYSYPEAIAVRNAELDYLAMLEEERQRRAEMEYLLELEKQEERERQERARRRSYGHSR